MPAAIRPAASINGTFSIWLNNNFVTSFNSKTLGILVGNYEIKSDLFFARFCRRAISARAVVGRLYIIYRRPEWDLWGELFLYYMTQRRSYISFPGYLLLRSHWDLFSHVYDDFCFDLVVHPGEVFLKDIPVETTSRPSMWLISSEKTLCQSKHIFQFFLPLFCMALSRIKRSQQYIGGATRPRLR